MSKKKERELWFGARESREQVEQFLYFAPKFDDQGLISVFVTELSSGEVLLHGKMTAQALAVTLNKEQLVLWSREKDCLWHVGGEYGEALCVEEVLTNREQDCILVKTVVPPARYKNSFFRRLPLGDELDEVPGGEVLPLRRRKPSESVG